MDKINQQLEYLQESTKKREELKQQLQAKERLFITKEIDVHAFKKVMKKEKKDVDKLEHFSVARIMAKRKSNFDERLQGEIDEYKDANQVYQTMVKELNELKQLIEDLRVKYDRIKDDENDYQKLLQLKRNKLEQAIPDFKDTLQNLEKEVSHIILKIGEVRKEYEIEQQNVNSSRYTKSNANMSSNPVKDQPGRSGDFKRGYAEKQQYDIVKDTQQRDRDINKDYKESEYSHKESDIITTMMVEITSIEEKIKRIIIETNID